MIQRFGVYGAVVGFLLMPVPTHAQSITRQSQIVAGEYFVGSDPGVGKATPISISSPSTTVTSSVLNVRVPVGQAVHFRFKNANGIWSPVRSLVFTGTGVNRTALLSHAEYFIGPDPGIGGGKSISVSNARDSQLNLASINLTRGRYIHLRVEDDQGRWSAPVDLEYPSRTVEAAEVVVGNNPNTVAVGHGIPMIPISGGFGTGTVNLQATLTNWNKSDTIWVRAMSSDHLWSEPVGTNGFNNFSGPKISRVTVAPLVGQNMEIKISGSGFGISNPFDGDTTFLKIQNVTRNWDAGCSNDFVPDWVTVHDSVWADTEIVISRFEGQYNSLLTAYQYQFNTGDSLEFFVQNPQSPGDTAKYALIIPSFLSVNIPPDSVTHSSGYGLLFNQNEIASLTSNLLSRVEAQGFFRPEGGGVTVVVDSASPSSNLNLDVAALDFLMGLPGLVNGVTSSFEEVGVWGAATSAATEVLSPLPSVVPIALSVTGNVLNGVLAVSRQDWATWLSTATISNQTVKYVVPPSETIQIDVPLSSVPKTTVNINLSGVFENVPLAIAPASIGQLPSPVADNAYTEEQYDLHPYCYVMDLWGNPITGVSVTGIKRSSGEIPKRFNLSQNYPNPFNPTTTIDFALKENSRVELSFFNVLGQRVQEFDLGRLSAGTYSQTVDMSRFASGVYFYRIIAVGTDGQRFTATKKMLELK